jgi:hypothetical protein
MHCKGVHINHKTKNNAIFTTNKAYKQNKNVATLGLHAVQEKKTH